MKHASLCLFRVGLSVYPHHEAKPVPITDEFVFLGGQESLTPRQIERHYLEGIRNAKFVYAVATNGYVGRSSATEIAYALVIGKPVVLSEPISTYGPGVPSEIARILQETRLPLLPTPQLENFSKEQLVTFIEGTGKSQNFQARKKRFLVHCFLCGDIFDRFILLSQKKKLL